MSWASAVIRARLHAAGKTVFRLAIPSRCIETKEPCTAIPSHRPNRRGPESFREMYRDCSSGGSVLAPASMPSGSYPARNFHHCLFARWSSLVGARPCRPKSFQRHSTARTLLFHVRHSQSTACCSCFRSVGECESMSNVQACQRRRAASEKDCRCDNTRMSAAYHDRRCIRKSRFQFRTRSGIAILPVRTLGHSQRDATQSSARTSARLSLGISFAYNDNSAMRLT